MTTATQGTTHFERLGLPQRFAVTPEAVESNYLLRSREVHPDFHQLGPAAQQRASTEATAALNEAFNALRDPFRRADYLLALEGGPTAAEHREMTPEFLEEMLDLRSQIEELRAAANNPGGQDALNRMEAELLRRRDRLVEKVAGEFAMFERLPADDAGRPVTLRRVREALNTARYVEGLLRDLRAD